MAIARRLYFYVVAGIGLGLLLAGASTMLRLVLEALGLPKGSASIYEIPDPNANKAALSLALAYVVVGLPLWLVHWGFIERSAQRADDAGGEERVSTVRSLFFLIVLAVLLYAAAAGLFAGLREWIATSLGADDPSYAYGYWRVSVAANLATALLLGAAWAYHARVRIRDLRMGPAPVQGAARTLRLYAYGAALIALAVAVQAVWSLGSTVVDATAGHEPRSLTYDYGMPSQVAHLGTAAWWVWPAISAVLTLAIVVPIWLGHSRFADRLLRPDYLGEQEARSRMRLLYFAGVVLVTASLLAMLGADAAAPFFGRVLDATDPNGNEVWRNLAVAVLVGAVPAALLLVHRRRAMTEAVGGDPTAAGAEGLVDYVVAAVGLYLLAYGLAQGFENVLRIAFNQNPWGLQYPVGMADPRPWAAALGFGYGLAGFLLWAPAWAVISRRLFRAGNAESASPWRRAYLFLVVGASLLTSAFAMAMLIQRAARVALDAGSFIDSNPNSDSLALVIVALPILVYHLAVLRLDFRAAAATPEEAVEGPAEVGEPVGEKLQPEPTPAAAAVPSPELVIVGPAGADLDALRQTLAPSLPPGFRAEVRHG